MASDHRGVALHVYMIRPGHRGSCAIFGERGEEVCAFDAFWDRDDLVLAPHSPRRAVRVAGAPYIGWTD